MPFELEAVYESGILKLDHLLPLEEQQRVKVVVQDSPAIGCNSKQGEWWQALQDVLANQTKRGFVGAVAEIDRSDDGYEQRMRDIFSRNSRPGSTG